MIDSNNKLKTLSQSLIDAVRGVMEAKEGGHPKTEKQKDLAAKAPPHDKITHADVLAARGVLKKHPVHGKLVVAKEEAEEVDEATMSAKAGAAGKDLGKPGKTFSKIAKSAAEKYGSKEAGMKVAGAVLKKMRANEEVEDLDELSKATLRSYAQNAKDQMSRSDTLAGREMGARSAGAKPSAKERFHNRRADKRHAGLGLAIDKLAREEVEDLEELSTKTLDSYRTKARNQIVAARNKDTDTTEKRLKGYTQASKSIGKNFVKGVSEEAEDLDEAMDAGARFKHHHDHAKALLKSIGDHLKAEHEAAMKSTDYKGRKGPNWGHVGSMEHVATQLGQIHDMLARKGEWAESVEVEDEVTLSEEEIASLDQIAESIEDLEELSTDTLRKYREKAREDAFDADAVDDERRLRKRSFGHNQAGKKIIKRGDSLRAEEVEEIDEARGRPPKEGSAAWKRRQEAEKKGETEGDEPRQHIIQQLQRAKLSMQGGAKIKFKNGEEHDVKGSHAAKLLDKYSGMKPAEKEAFQKKIGSSHASLKSEL